MMRVVRGWSEDDEVDEKELLLVWFVRVKATGVYICVSKLTVRTLYLLPIY